MEQWVQKMEHLLTWLEQWVREQPLENIYVALAAIILTSVFFVLFSCLKRSKSNTIILAGLSGSGKTTFFYQLRDGSSHQGTVTSMEPNSDMFVLHSEADKKDKLKPARVVDIPGHSRLRPLLDEYLPQAAGLVFLTKYLYDLLTKASVVKRGIPIDSDKLRTSRTAISTADVSNEYTLGVPGETLAFSQCVNKVTVAESSCITGEISHVEQFIRVGVGVVMPWYNLTEWWR